VWSRGLDQQKGTYPFKHDSFCFGGAEVHDCFGGKKCRITTTKRLVQGCCIGVEYNCCEGILTDPIVAKVDFDESKVVMREMVRDWCAMEVDSLK
jgi:hypothetical protein